MAQVVATPSEPSYPDILRIDSRIRDFDVPNVLRMIDHDGVAPHHPKALQQAMIACTREIGEYMSFVRRSDCVGVCSLLGYRSASPIAPELLHFGDERDRRLQGYHCEVRAICFGSVHELLQFNLDGLHSVPVGTRAQY